LFRTSEWKKALPLALARRGIDRLVIAAPLQRRFAIERLRFRTQKVADIPWSIDTRFWRPLPGAAGDGICSVGVERRDYATLLEVLGRLEIPCHIAAASRRSAGRGTAGGLDVGPLAGRVTVGPLAPAELRALYAGSRFVVVPLLPSDSDNGITTCLEAMAMGKAVVCSATRGQVGVLEHEVNALLVSPQDPAALQAAIERLWADPVLCERLGRAGRALVEERYSDERVIPRLAAVAAEAIEQSRRRR